MQPANRTYTIVAIIVIAVIALWLFNSQDTATTPEGEQTTDEQQTTETPSVQQTGPAPTSQPSQPSAPKTSIQSPTASPLPQVPASQAGRMVFAVTDAPPSLSAIAAVTITIDDIEVHSVKRGAWLNIPVSAKTYNLLDLRNSSKLAFLADTQLEIGEYNQLRINVSKITVTKNDASEHTAKLPSGRITFGNSFKIEQGRTSVGTFDFALDKSLHETSDGTYLFAPVVTLSARGSALVNIKGDGTIGVSSGTSAQTQTVGMDENGSVKNNFTLDQHAVIEFLGDTIKIIPQTLSDVGMIITAPQAIEIAKNNNKISAAKSVKLEQAVFGDKTWNIVGTNGATVKVHGTTGAVLENQ